MADGSSLVERLRTAALKRACRAACLLGRKELLKRPVFIVGCGRSGTTALGDALSVHPSVTYLNEYRHLWTDAYPETDVWSPRAEARGGRLELGAEACTPTRTARLRRNFYCETAAARGPKLVEKLPINSFRIAFIDAIFPDAQFVHLLRNGLEVARSIERMPADPPWYGHADYKWNRLVEFARSRERYGDLPDLCDTARLRGLLEWRMAVESAVERLEGIPPERQTTVTYAELLESPVEVIERIESFIGVEPSEDVHRFAQSNLRRRSPKIDVTGLSEVEERLAGDLMRRLGYLPA